MKQTATTKVETLKSSMKKMSFSQAENPRLTSQFRQLFIGAQVAAVCGIINLALFGENLIDSNSALFFRMDLITYAIGVLGTFSLITLLNQGLYMRAMTIFLSMWSCVMVFATWFGGGLNSPLLLSFPILLIFAAQFTQLAAFLSILAFLTAAVLFMGFNYIHGWILPPAGMAIDGIPSMISAIVLIVLSGYVCWVFGRILNDSFSDLQQENERVLKSQNTIRKLADCDSLTNVLNRNGAKSRYQALLEQTDFTQEKLVAYFIDLDNFKSINDLFDHEAGDQLLVTMSERLTTLLGDTGFVCRFGGDEFVCIIQVEQAFNVDAFSNQIITTLAQPHYILGTEAEVTASIGIFSLHNANLSFNAVCKKADVAMHKAKQSGKNQSHAYSAELHRDYMRNLNILDRLKNALSENLLDLHFQPQINLQSNKIESAEALLRWNRGNDEGIQPDEFIPIIESTELIHSIGTWVIDEACHACKQWREAGIPLKVAINVSALQLTRTGFYQTIYDALARNNLPPEALEIEITEHSLLKDVSIVKTQLAALKELGAGLVIDDFGTGYSNMGYLTHLQIDTLKLDRSFISQVGQSEEHRVIVTAIIEMAKVLGMKVVAEGIETTHDRDILANLACDFGQGYLWSFAVPSPELIDFVQDFEAR